MSTSGVLSQPSVSLPEGALATTPAVIPARKSIPLSQRSFRKSVDLKNGGLGEQEISLQDPTTSVSLAGSSKNPMSAQDVINTSSNLPGSIAHAFTQDKYIRSGWLYKRGKRKTWKKRWFVLRENQLVYYKDDKEYKPKDIISTSDIMAVAMLTDQHKPNHFAYFTPSKNYHLRAETTQDAEQWVAKLKETLEYASQQALSSSFQRLNTLDEVEPIFQSPFSPPSVKPASNRHSIMTSSTFGHPNTQKPTHVPKRHSINVTMNPSSSGLANRQNLNENTLLNKLPSPPSKQSSTDNISSVPKSVESALSAASKDSYNSASIFSGKEDLGQSSCPSDHGSPIILSNIEREDTTIKSKGNTTPGPHIRQKSDLSVLGNVNQYDQEFEDQETALAPPKHGETILETGHLLRLKKRYRQWQNQWVVLSNERLVFYKNEKSKSPVKVISIENLIDVVELDAMSKTKQYCMQLITPEKRMRFCALSEEELIRWLAAIKAVIDASPNTASIEYDLIEEE